MLLELEFLLLITFAVGRNFEFPRNWSDDDEVASNIDDYSAADDIENYDELIRLHNENSTSTNNQTSVFRFIRELRNMSRYSGETIKLTCEVYADPLQVDLKWFKNDAPILLKRKGRISAKYIERKQQKTYVSRLKITNLEVHDSGFYKCSASTGLQTRSSTGVLIVKPKYLGPGPNSQDLVPDFVPQIPNFKNILKTPSINLLNHNTDLMASNPVIPDLSMGPFYPYPICEPYRGVLCKKYLSEHDVFILPNMSQQLIEAKLSSAFKVINPSPDLTEQCAAFAAPTLCYSLLPVCKTKNPPKPDLICREDCEMLENEICRVEYAIAKRHNVLGQVINFSDCSLLPSTDCRYLGVTTSSQPDEMDTRLQSAFIAVGGMIFVAFLILCYFCCSRRKSRRRKREQILANKFKMSPGKASIIKVKSGSDCSVAGSRRETSSLIPNSSSSSQKSERRNIKVVEFNFASIKFEEELGEGAFGKVYRGEVTISNNEKMLVAIKTLKENANSKTVGEFKREVELMSELRHPNIISLLGVCMTNRLCMLFEFMSHGDLHEYLIAHSPNQDVPRNSIEPILEQEDLMNISIQIAAGMEYLCSQHFVHRDLATRNCLVGENLVVKISDFGLSRDVYSSDYYRVQKSALLPIRWMSPESILYGKFTVESDIWSYGVVLWEIYSYGLQPYYAHSNQDVVDMIRSHQVLPSPEGCPPRMYALMIECWNQVPSRRPQFTEIHARLVQWRDSCSSSDKTDSTQLSHHMLHKSHHHQLHGYPAVPHSVNKL